MWHHVDSMRNISIIKSDITTDQSGLDKFCPFKEIVICIRNLWNTWQVVFFIPLYLYNTVFFFGILYSDSIGISTYMKSIIRK